MYINEVNAVEPERLQPFVSSVLQMTVYLHRQFDCTVLPILHSTTYTAEGWTVGVYVVHELS